MPFMKDRSVMGNSKAKLSDKADSENEGNKFDEDEPSEIDE